MIVGRRFWLILLGIVAVAFVLRIYTVDSIPPGVNRDEASIGYTAYSLLKTEKDEYGIAWPISFRSFGDWKLPLYIYATMAPVALFGLNEFAVRFVSVIVGTATVLLTAVLVRLFFPLHKKRDSLSLISATLLTVSPWHTHFSRVGSEANLAVFFTTLGLVLFFAARNRPWSLVLSSLSFAATLFTYHGNHVFTPLLVGSLIVLFRKEVRNNAFRWISLALFGILAGFILVKTLPLADTTKLAGIHILSDPVVIHTRIDQARMQHGLSSLSALFHNKVFLAVDAFTRNYVRSFSPEFLYFWGGGNRAHNIPNFGNAYLLELPFLLLAILILIQKRSREHMLLLFWFFISPLAASITKDAPHSARMLAVLPALPIIVGYGIVEAQQRWKNFFVNAGVAVLFIVSLLMYLDAYFVHFPVLASRDWGIGYKKVYDYLIEKRGTYDRIVFTRPQDSPYIFLLFYGKYDPAKFQKEVERYPPTPDGFSHVKRLGNMFFRPPVYNDDVTTYGLLLVEWTLDLPKPVLAEKVRQDIAGSDGESHLSIVSWEDKK